MTKKLLLLAVTFLTVAGLNAADLIELRSVPQGSKVRIEGTSSIHDWQVESTLIGGTARVGPGFPLEPGAEVKPGPIEASVDVAIPVNQLKSVKKDGEPYSDKMDTRMYEAMKEPANRRITYKLKELVLKQAPKTGEPYQFESKGDLCVAGVTNAITMPVTATVLESGKVKFAGSINVKMTDFKIEPINISILGIGLIKTGDDVKLFFEWVAARRAATTTP